MYGRSFTVILFLSWRISFICSFWCEDDELITNDFSLIALLASLIFPAAGFDPAFHVHFVTFLDILLCYFSEFSPENHIMILWDILLDAGLVGVATIGCHREIGNMLAIWCHTNFWIGRDIADNLCLVE